MLLQVVELVGPEDVDDDSKISSSGARKMALGRFCGEGLAGWIINDGQQGSKYWVRRSDPSMPYVIGLTGGIASGKTTLAAMLAEKGAAVIDCDKLGHLAYTKGSETFEQVVQAFGSTVVDPETGEINRRQLGAMVFGGDGTGLQTLNGIVWPAIRRLVTAEVKRAGSEGAKVCVVEAAVLLEAGWDDMADEVWAVIVSESSAVERLMKRNGLSEEAAKQRLGSQMNNTQRISRAHLILCNQWDLAEARRQVDMAWDGMQRRSCRVLLGCRHGASPPPGATEGEVFMWAEWCSATEALDVAPSASVDWFRRLWGLYTARGRFYHNLSHVEHVLSVVSSSGVKPERPPLLTMAIFFHDAIYDPARTDSEARSSELFLEFAAATMPARPPVEREMVAKWILQTAGHVESAEDGEVSGDLGLLLDADLAILGSCPALYARYTEAIRREFSHLGEAEWITGRSDFITRVLSRRSVFSTPSLAGLLEERARANMVRELERLRAMASVYKLPGF